MKIEDLTLENFQKMSWQQDNYGQAVIYTNLAFSNKGGVEPYEPCNFCAEHKCNDPGCKSILESSEKD